MSGVRFTVTKAEGNPIGEGADAAANYGSHELQSPVKAADQETRSNGRTTLFSSIQ